MERMTVLVGHSGVTLLDQPTTAMDELLPPLEALELPQGVLQALTPWVPQPHLSIKRLPAAPAVDLAQAPTATVHSAQERVAGDQRRMLPGLPVTLGARQLPALPPGTVPLTQRATGVNEAEREHFPAEASLVMVSAASARSALVTAEPSPKRRPSLPATWQMPIDSASANPPGEGLRVPSDNGRISGTLLVPPPHLSTPSLPAAPAVDPAQALTATAHSVQERGAGDQRRIEHVPAEACLVRVSAASAGPAVVAAELSPMRASSLPATLRMPIDSAPANPPGEGLRVPFDNGRISGTLLITGNESTQGMLVTPDKSVLLEQLREPFLRLDQPAWRLSERADDRDQPYRRAHADEPEDESEQSR